MDFKEMTTPLNVLVAKVDNEPALKMVYSGIKENSLGFVFGPSKSAKTTFCENLGLSIASGQESYLGLPINIENKKVLFLSLEEFYKSRTERNKKQCNPLVEKLGDKWIENYIVANENFLRYVVSNEDWEKLEKTIEDNKPGIVFIDSLSRLYEGNIEDSKLAKELTKRLRELCNKMQTTIVIIHHTPKLNNSPLTIHSLAGSRILGQEGDFFIGFNKTIDGTRYLKEVSFRYAPENHESVKVFEIDQFQWLRIVKEEDEAVLLSEFDGRRNNENYLVVSSFVSEIAREGGKEIKAAEFNRAFLDSKIMAKPTLYDCISKLIAAKRLTKLEHGVYSIA